MSHFCSVAREHPDIMVCSMPYYGMAPWSNQWRHCMQKLLLVMLFSLRRTRKQHGISPRFVVGVVVVQSTSLVIMWSMGCLAAGQSGKTSWIASTAAAANMHTCSIEMCSCPCKCRYRFRYIYYIGYREYGMRGKSRYIIFRSWVWILEFNVYCSQMWNFEGSRFEMWSLPTGLGCSKQWIGNHASIFCTVA